MSNFWSKLKKPILVQAPMEEVTDTVFRQMLARYGRPGVFFTEFTNCSGLQSDAYEKVAHRLKYSEVERPIVAQVWGITPDDYYKSGQMIKELGFDGIDINMGCPVKKIIKSGACSALIKNPTLAAEIIAAVKSSAGDLAVSVKTRIGFDKVVTEEWIGFLLDQDLDALTIHGRIAKEMSKYPANWVEIAKGVELRNKKQKSTVIIGNGDVIDLTDAQSKITQYKVDGVMVGRGLFNDIGFFNPDKSQLSTLDQKLDALKAHLELYNSTWQGSRPFGVMKKLAKVYLHGFAGAKELRNKFYETENIEEAIALVSQR